MLILKEKDVPDDLRKFFRPAGWARGENCAERDWVSGCHVCRMVLVFREVRRVLRDDGILFLNYGDTYANTSCGGESPDGPRSPRAADKDRSDSMRRNRKETYGNLKPGNLVGVPWRIALALQADGWILRQDIVWAKPSPMPESCKNRCTKSHEYVFLLVKKSGYFCDMEAIREPYDDPERGRNPVAESRNPHHGRLDDPNKGQATFTAVREYNPAGRNKRSVWTIASQGYPGLHFATFPPKLIEPMILAGTSAKGCCGKCGTPWRRVVERIGGARAAEADRGDRDRSVGRNRNGITGSLDGEPAREETVGWEPGCECFGKLVKRKGVRLGYGSYHSHDADGIGYGLRQDGGPVSDPGTPTKEFEATITEYVSDLPLDQHPVVPCTVLDPFLGSGTTCAVSVRLGRRSWGIDLSEKYLRENAVPRIEEAMSMASGSGLSRVEWLER